MLRILISALVSPILKGNQTNKVIKFKENIKGALPILPVHSTEEQRLNR